MTATPEPGPGPGSGFQAAFERRWGHLTRPHVRALAWLLDAPDLLNPAAPQWQGRIATLAPPSPSTADWLAALERDPAALDAALGARFYSRLGLYAEKLMAFYFAEHGLLQAHGLQVRAGRNDTVGEFDFLLRDDGRLLHWEFATKFYLHDPADGVAPLAQLVGPNLADTLAAKMSKILDKQLALASHPAAQALLDQPVDEARALVKGWLFYRPGQRVDLPGIAPGHCHGYWVAESECAALDGDHFVILPRLQWLAPCKAPLAAGALARQELQALVADHMAHAAAPLMVARVAPQGQYWVECERGFVVPDDWRIQAAARRLSGALPG